MPLHRKKRRRVVGYEEGSKEIADYSGVPGDPIKASMCVMVKTSPSFRGTAVVENKSLRSV